MALSRRPRSLSVALRCEYSLPLLPTLRVLWQLSAAHADKTYIVYEDERLTYAEVDARVRSLAHYLRQTCGVDSGDRVAIAMRNYPEWVIAYWATVSIGAAVVGMNAWWTSTEMEFALTDSRPKVLIADDERLERVLPVLDARAFDGTPARHRGALGRGAAAGFGTMGRRGRARRGSRCVARRRHRSRRRCVHLLHLGYDRHRRRARS